MIMTRRPSILKNHVTLKDHGNLKDHGTSKIITLALLALIVATGCNDRFEFSVHRPLSCVTETTHSSGESVERSCTGNPVKLLPVKIPANIPVKTSAERYADSNTSGIRKYP